MDQSSSNNHPSASPSTPDSPISAEMELSKQTHMGDCTESSNTSSSPSHERIDNQSSNMASSSSTHPNHDYLASLPNEILIKVISEIPISDYLAPPSLCAEGQRRSNLQPQNQLTVLVHCSVPGDRNRFCWLVPKHEDITDLEDDYDAWLEVQFTEECIEIYDHDEVKHFSLLGQHFPEEVRVQDEEELIHIKISGPGPQYLLLLESDMLDICDGGREANCYESQGEQTVERRHSMRVPCSFHMAM